MNTAHQPAPQPVLPPHIVTGQQSWARRLLNLPFACVYALFSLVQLIVLACIPQQRFTRLYKSMECKEQKARITSLTPHLRPNEQVLDVGAGSGRFGRALEDALQVRMTGVDVIDYADPAIPVHLYDGNTLPFPDKSFDTIIIAFVLHHITNQEQIMAELTRCTRRQIIILEDTYDTPWQRLFVMWNDFHTNILQEYIKVWKGYSQPGVTDMPMPLTFRSVTQWMQFFKQYPVSLTTTTLRHAKYKPLSKVMFCLKVVRRSGGK